MHRRHEDFRVNGGGSTVGYEVRLFLFHGISGFRACIYSGSSHTKERPAELLYYLFLKLRRPEPKPMARRPSFPAKTQTKSAVLNQFPASRRLLACCFVAVIFCGVAGAQSKLLPGIEVFGGCSHMSFQ